MKILFIHQNFPAQFRSLAPALAAAGHQVLALTVRQGAPDDCPGVRRVIYRPTRGSTPNLHPWLIDFETKTIRGEACFRAALALRQEGFVPDLILAHPGWGESLFLNEVWPRARLAIYCEFYYRLNEGDVNFDPEFPTTDPGEACRLRLKNLSNQMHFEVAAAGLAPTRWQASTFPEPFRSRITVIHDGIDTDALSPDPNASLALDTHGGGRLVLTRADEVVTFVNRNLEPYRGYHRFMRALPEVLRRRPHAQIMIVGGNEVSYGAGPGAGRNWRDLFAAEVRPAIRDQDWRRVHFLGRLPYQYFVALLRVSRVHVYFTYPFVLSWSLLEAMSLGCTILASDTPPLHEAIIPDETGRLVGFFDQDGLVEELCALLDDSAARARLGRAARDFARAHYDLKSICLPRQLDWVADLGGHV